jgi:glutamine synthetase
MKRTKTDDDEARLIVEWTLPAAATLGSSVRARGILLEMRARLPLKVRRALDIKAGTLALRLPESEAEAFRAAAAIVSAGLEGIENLPVIPREIEDILSIKTSERHRWLKDGRLPSAGTRTVKLHGRARKITFHIFDPRRVEELLDSGVIDEWREQDAETARENRRRAAWNRKLARAEKAGQVARVDADVERVQLVGWEEFARAGLLR